jgi:hypothetical protein
MDEETLEAIKQKYELSVITAKEAEKTRYEKQKLLESATFDFDKSKRDHSHAVDDINKNRKEYENALYEFWEINNE